MHHEVLNRRDTITSEFQFLGPETDQLFHFLGPDSLKVSQFMLSGVFIVKFCKGKIENLKICIKFNL